MGIRKLSSGWTLAAVLLILLTGLVWPGSAAADHVREHITLHLKWRHQFQFAGYYAAIEHGFFEEEGLAVSLIEGRPGTRPSDALLNDQADFAIDSPHALVEAARGKPLVLVASIFQHSPLALVTLKSSGLETIHDLIGKKVMVDAVTGTYQADIWSMFQREGISPDKLIQYDHSYSINDLLEGRVDAMSIYVTNELDRLNRRNIAVNLIRPTSYGVDFYGDVLVTHRRMAKQRPGTVDAMVRAVRRGWDYAMRHPEEIADLIIRRYDTLADRQHLLREAAALQPILQAEHVEIGHSNHGRWQMIARAYHQLGLLPSAEVPSGFLLQDFNLQRQQSQDRWRDMTITVAGVALCIAMLALMFNSRLRAMVHQRTRALSESEERFRTLANSMPFLIWISSLDRGCNWFNAGWLAFTGRSMAEELGDGWATGVHPDDLLRCMQVYSDHFDRQKPFQMEYRLRRHDGDYRWIVDVGAPRFMDDGTFAGFAGACLDITDRKQAEAELQASRQELAHSNEALQHFAYAASHDLQEPLRMISSYLQLLDRRYQSVLDEQGREFLHFAVDGAQRMQGLITELLEFSRLGSRKMEKTHVPLQDCWDLAQHNLQIAIQESGAHITCPPLPKVYGCPGQLTRLLQNILGNGIKYRAAGVHPHITVSWLSLSPHWVQITVQDDGIGIPPDQCEAIFALFTRLQRQQDYPGTGMGLAMCRKIVEMHGGTIKAHSAGPGQGTSLVFTLPTKADV